MALNWFRNAFLGEQNQEALNQGTAILQNEYNPLRFYLLDAGAMREIDGGPPEFLNFETGEYEQNPAITTAIERINQGYEDNNGFEVLAATLELVEAFGPIALESVTQVREIMAELEAEEESNREPLVVFEDPDDGTLSVGIPQSRYREFYPESKEDEDEGEAEGSGKKSRGKGRAMDKNKNAELQREDEMAWYRKALDRRQNEVTKGVEGFDGAGMSKWAMTDAYQQAEMADKSALRLAQRRAVQNWLGAKTFRPFWGNGIMG
jgi:hypothetical protein